MSSYLWPPNKSQNQLSGKRFDSPNMPLNGFRKNWLIIRKHPLSSHFKPRKIATKWGINSLSVQVGKILTF